MRHYKKILKKTRTDTQMKLYIVARPTLLYWIEIGVITKRDVSHLVTAVPYKCQKNAHDLTKQEVKL
jgi:hypothetical protein